MPDFATRPRGHGPAPADLPLKVAIARLCNGISPGSLVQAQSDWLLHLATTPSKQAELAASALHKTWGWALALALPQAAAGAAHARALADKRFARPEWRRPPWNAVADAFQRCEQWWGEATHGVRGVSPHHQDVVAFVARQWLDMCSPSNFVATNPQVLAETLRTGGRNLAAGFANWLRDASAVQGGGKPRGVGQFRPGQAVALTPGKVVMRNHLVELLQYDPATPQVDREPVLVVPSWIMKFYILDLEPQASLVRYLVEQGHTVFMLSWRNPGSGDAGLGMEDYLRHGVLAAIDAVRAACPRCRLHAAGYCLGGTLLAMAAALPGPAKEALATVTLLAAQVDFGEPGELGLFIDESQISFLEDLMAEHGYLDGVQMAGAFQLINSKDLVWSKLVHEYLMGAQTPMTALRAWNADATRMPARMHAEYLRHLYLHNDLAEGRYRVAGDVARLERIDRPMFVVATERDHVSPWPSVYKVHHLVSAPVEFVLASGGHNVGIVSPPHGPQASPEAGYRRAHSAARHAPSEPRRWFEAAPLHRGSWWPHWHRWLHDHSSGRVRARAARPMPGHAPVAAPGTYLFDA